MNIQIVFLLSILVFVNAGITSILEPTSSEHLHHTSWRPHLSRLRHSRHLGGGRNNHGPSPASDDFTYSASSYNGLGAQKIDATKLTVHGNRKPVFSNCSRYQPSVQEELPSGTEVLKVTAVDRDPPDAGGTVNYTFVSAPGERLKFNIDPDTGLITTKNIFDRDEPNREKEMYLTVRATDNGRPQLDDVCTIKVTIEDVNDNRPVFDKANYLESVPQDLRVGREVMRISATDIDDGNNSIVVYELEPKSESDRGYFRVDKSTGVIYLNRTLDREPSYKFQMNATATDLGVPPRSAHIELEILVVESHKKAPTFTSVPEASIVLPENYHDYQTPIATLTAESNIPEEELVFMIVSGRTEQTNQRNTFILESEGPTAHIKLGRQLDYEAITEYTITIRVQNKYNLAAETVLNIIIQDVNDNIPVFTEVMSGTVLEHELEGAPVMQVRAIDADGTFNHNQVKYELGDHQDLFSIDPYTGNITTKVMFDREEKDFYIVKVVATDNSQSALLTTGEHNKGQQVFHIEIGDINDNKPKFTKKVYIAEAVEDANIHSLVTEVRALDNDTASDVTYSIEEGNTYDAFLIEKNTGKIRVNNLLDYENTTSYTLLVRAFDGIYDDFAKVEIKIENVNDNRPVFLPFNEKVTIKEEELVEGCIAKLEAYDPDIQSRQSDQHIKYFVVKQDQQKLLAIDKDGCLTLIKPLDRDPPNGFPQWQVLISAKDEDGGPTSLSESTEVIIILTDINDNAPYLSMPMPVVWPENHAPGIITKLEASDNDSESNGAPFDFVLDSSAGEDITSNFRISIGSDGTAQIEALRTFDRETQKVYHIPIAISDSGHPSQTGTSILTLVIGDENDNAMKAGSSEIFVYNYKGLEGTVIGRVYVDDPDDWDLPDKTFSWKDGIYHPNFELDTTSGELTVTGNPNGTYFLEFSVVEESALIARHTVEANVNVTVKQIPEEAVDKSGSIRLMNITAEQFVEPLPGQVTSRRDILRDYISSIFNISYENVDVFTVLHANPDDLGYLDVRFSAHSSPYYEPEKLNGRLSQNSQELERLLKAKIYMVNIDECLLEKVSCESSCMNRLEKYERPYAVFTNTSSFVGVHAQVVAECTCTLREDIWCLNGGTPVGQSCECPEGYEGPHCETIDVGFSGDGYAWYPPLQACEKGTLSLELQANKEDGLVFYVGPLTASSGVKVQDFMSLELSEGYARLLVDYGSGTAKLEQRQLKLADGQKHHIEVQWSSVNIELKVDSCTMGSCLSLTAPEGPNEFLNVNGPLQVGGASVQLGILQSQMGWKYKPTDMGLHGCVRNLTFNGKVYNLGEPSFSKNAVAGCNRFIATAITFGIDTNFLVAILVCIAVLLILVLAVVVHRRRSDDMYKDQDDIRENIINYEDEGGGEGDMTGYDLNVLRLVYDGQPGDDVKRPQRDFMLNRSAPDEVPDICGFLDSKKRQVDDDPDAEPFDNVRHYAYEGDGNSTGSLSSLASGTDEGDLNFGYLSDFGPRFRKLADMYGEHSSDESEENFEQGASESWC